MARSKPKITPESAPIESMNPAGFDADKQAWAEDLANSCVPPSQPSDELPARSGDDEDASKIKTPNPYPFRSDRQTGVVLQEDRQLRKMQLKFDTKPSDEVRQALREAGFRWKAQNQAWEISVDREQSWPARATADTLFQQVTGMIRQELGVGQEVS